MDIITHNYYIILHPFFLYMHHLSLHKDRERRVIKRNIKKTHVVGKRNRGYIAKNINDVSRELSKVGNDASKRKQRKYKLINCGFSYTIQNLYFYTLEYNSSQCTCD